jgi:hypothetical protein
MNSFLDKLNLKPQERRLVVIVAIVIFIGLNIWFVFPVFGELGRAQERIRYQRKLLSDFQDEVNKKPAYEKELSQLKSKGPSPCQLGEPDTLRCLKKKFLQHKRVL